MIRTLNTFAIAAAGVALFSFLDLPLPWLLGPILGCLFAALVGIRMGTITVLNTAMRGILGVAVGATFTTALFASMGAMWPTLLMIPVMTASIGLIGVPYFQRIWGFDFPTAYYSAMPGGLQDMLIFGEEAGGDVRAMSLVHATRVLFIVATLPFILKAYWDVDLSVPPGAPAADIAPAQLALMVFCGLVGWKLAERVGLFGASILGPMILAGAFALAGILQFRPPAEAIWAAQFFIGMSVGVKYSGITMREVRIDLTAALGFCVILLGLTVVFAEVIHIFELAPPLETLLAFAPGGQAEMAILALIVGADMAFVIAHHVLRILIVIIGAPLFSKLFRR